jgi:hypothetical protein
MEDIFIEPHTLNPEPEDYLGNLYMEEAQESESLEVPPPVNYPEDLYMDTGKDLDPPDPPEPSQPTIAPPSPSNKTTRTKLTDYLPPGGGAYFPTTQLIIKRKKKVLPPVQPRMKKGGIENLWDYNKDFKRWQMRLVGQVLDNKETIKAYVFGLESRILVIFMGKGYSYKSSRCWLNGNKQQR